MSSMILSKGRVAPAARKAAGRDVAVIASLVIVAIGAVLAVAGPWLTPYDPDALFVGDALETPSPAHWFGTDDVGRDLLSRVIIGARPTLVGAAIVVILSVAAGVGLALVAAWRGGWVDAVIARLGEVVFVIPGIVLAILAVTMFGQGLVAPVLALSLAYVPVILRLMRTAARTELSRPYIEALWVQGVGTPAIMVRHVIPAMAPTVLAQAAIGFGYAMLDLAAISYLGLGQQLPRTDWGLMISQGQAALLQGFPYVSLFPAVLVVATVLAVNVLGARVVAWAEEVER